MRPLPIKTAAAQAGVNRRTLQRWVREGRVQKLQDGKVDLDEVSNQKDYLSSARRRGPVPGRPKGPPLDPFSDEVLNREMLEEKRRLDAAIRQIDRIEDPVFLAFIVDHAMAKLPSKCAKALQADPSGQTSI